MLLRHWLKTTIDSEKKVMTWLSHKILSGSFVYAITGSGIAAFFTAAGSIIPDAMEGLPNKNNYSKWRKNHRQITHWFIPYLVGGVILFAFAILNGVHEVSTTTIRNLIRYNHNEFKFAVISYAVAFIAVGALLHCMQDAICGTIPSINPTKRIGKRFFVVRSPKEYVLVGLMSITLVYVRSKLM